MRPANIIPKIFIGLGNPGDRYQHTRHNLGYLSIDSFVERHQLGEELEPMLKDFSKRVPGVKEEDVEEIKKKKRTKKRKKRSADDY